MYKITTLDTLPEFLCGAVLALFEVQQTFLTSSTSSSEESNFLAICSMTSAGPILDIKSWRSLLDKTHLSCSCTPLFNRIEPMRLHQFHNVTSLYIFVSSHSALFVHLRHMIALRSIAVRIRELRADIGEVRYLFS